MKLSNLLIAASIGVLLSDAIYVGNRVVQSLQPLQHPHERELLQDIVTWDNHSLFINGQRATIFSAEIHPFRLPVPSLYLDVFHKVKAMGFNMVSFYVDWALLEGKPGEFRAGGIFDLEAFFQAAKDAGIFLLARPGPYINAEVSGGGFPGWLQRVKGTLRTSSLDYISATDNYMKNIGSIIAKAQITNGGPVILFQPENEYSVGVDVTFPDEDYMKYVNDQARSAGIVVPLINNDAWPGGTGAPGSGIGAIDIYGHDGYPLGFDCANPNTWPKGNLPTTWHSQHVDISPKTPYSIIEFQGGAFDPPGGWGFEKCSVLTNHEFARVFYKNNLAAGVTIFNIYMTFGGTNWGNLGHCDGYTSYDYGAAIKEDRTIVREKYSEIKLQGQFLRVSPGYTISTPGNLSTSQYSNSADLAITPLSSKYGDAFFVVRHDDYSSTESTSYKLKLPTSAGIISIPQLGGSLSLHGRDSKIHVVDYPVGDYELLYSTAEVFTWKRFSDKTVLILYGGPNELHEVAVKNATRLELVEGSNVDISEKDNYGIIKWKTASERRVVQTQSLMIYLLDRNTAYNYWVPDLPGTGPNSTYGTSIMNPQSVIINGAYLVRSISLEGPALSVKADFNASTILEIIGVPKQAYKLILNGVGSTYRKSKLGNWICETNIKFPTIKTPDLSSQKWYYIDSLPEAQQSYNDSKWTVADHTVTNNTRIRLQNSVSLYASDYGFNAGAIIYRGYFIADGSETEVKLWTQGGRGYASSVWLNGKFLGSFKGYDASGSYNSTYSLPKLERGERYTFTIVVDNTGLNGNWTPGLDEQKSPRGIIDWAIVSGSKNVTKIILWKLTGNLGGEDFADTLRGPLNEGGFFFERQGYHLPEPPLNKFSDGSPFDGIKNAGVAFYMTKLRLDYPSEKFDIPLAFKFDNETISDTGVYRALLFVNGFQFGRYVSNIGPQTEFPVPEGILDYHGDNWIGVSLWALEDKGARLPGLSLTAGIPVKTGRRTVKVVQAPQYSSRPQAY